MVTATEDVTRLSLKDESSDESPIPRTDGFYALQKSVDRSPNGCAILDGSNRCNLQLL